MLQDYRYISCESFSQFDPLPLTYFVHLYKPLATRSDGPRSPVTLRAMTATLDATYDSAGALLTRAAGLGARLDTHEQAHGSICSSAYYNAFDKAQGVGRRHNLSRARLSALLGVVSGRTVQDITAALMSHGGGVFLTEAQVN